MRGDRLLFENLSLALDPGEAVLVTGPNGAGKTSLLRLIAGLLKPAAGSIAIEGSVALAAADAAALDGLLPLAAALGFWARLDRVEARAVADALDAMGIAGLAEVPVRMLSTGQRRRAALARVIAGGAGVWLLDEPGNGLDAAALEALGSAMARHRAAGGIIVAASHQPLGLAGAREVAL